MAESFLNSYFIHTLTNTTRTASFFQKITLTPIREVQSLDFSTFKPGLHEPQLPVERSISLVSSTVVERHCCALQVSGVARLQENKET